MNEYKKNKYTWELKVNTECPLDYIRQQKAQEFEFLFCVEIPWPALCLWRALVEKYPTSTYIDFLNASVMDGWFVIKSSCKRIEDLLYKNAMKASSVYSKATGRKKEALKEKKYKLSVRRNETETVQSKQLELEKALSEVEEWRKQYDDLSAEKEKLYYDMAKAITDMKEEITELKQANKELMEYIDILERNSNLKCIGHGKQHHELGAKQQRRRLNVLKTKAQCALWFSKSFGLDLNEIKLQDQHGKMHKIDYNTPEHSQTNTGGYNNLSENDKTKIEQVLFLLDKFCVSDEVYHELSLIGDGLPKSYLIKQKRTDLNKLNHIERLPGWLPGAAIDFTSSLKNHIRELLSNKPELKGETIKVKLSGDGARMSRSTNFMMLSFALLQRNEDVMSPKHNKTIAIVNGPESYETLQTSLQYLFQEINNLIEKQFISIDGNDVKVEFFLGGDLKFLLIIMGLNSAIADFSCLWCLIHKNDRWDTSKPMDYYNTNTMKRTIEDIKAKCKETENYGCIHEPLLNIPLTNVILDELHLLLRITDKLLQNVIDEVLERDAVEDFQKTRGQQKGLHLSKLIKSINDLGISFSIWNRRNADGSESPIKEFTSLLGSQKKKLLKKFPSKFDEFLNTETLSTVKQIWIDFGLLYDKLSDFNLTQAAANDLFHEGKAWIELFCSLRGKRSGYTRPRVTPYMHTIPYHIPHFIQNHGCLKKFTGQGVEKNNDDAKRIYFNKSNKWDAVTDILQTENRQWELRHCEREKGKYTKRRFEYWNATIFENRKKMRMEVPTQGLPAVSDLAEVPTIDYNCFTVAQLKQLIKEQNIKHKALSKLKKKELINLLENN